MEKSNLIWICSGERSGDGYGAELIHHLNQKAPDLKIAAMGGEKIASTGVEMLVHSDELAVFGITEVIAILPKFIAVMNRLIAEAKRTRPDAVVLIDFPGFNLRLARRLHSIGIRVIWYISPKVWAWGKNRIPDLAKICDPMMTIFPFEEAFFKENHMNVKFVGHPLVAMMKAKFDQQIKREKNTMLLLPGSRTGELKNIFPRMLECLYAFQKRRPEYDYIIAATDEKKAKILEKELQKAQKKWGGQQELNFKIVIGQTLEWMQRAELGFAASGTVTMECAIAGLPIVSVYAVDTISFKLFKIFVKLYRNFFTMINIIENRCIYEEYFQYLIHPFTIVPALERITLNGERRQYVEQALEDFSDHLTGGKHDAIECATDTILDALKTKPTCQPYVFTTSIQKVLTLSIKVLIAICILCLLFIAWNFFFETEKQMNAQDTTTFITP